ncbi:MAG: hypothetical protein ACE5DL_02340 [Nitrosopumilaceae archaeon]
MEWIDSLIHSIVGGGIAAIAVLIGDYYIGNNIREHSTKNDLIKYLEEVPKRNNPNIWINEIKHFIREKNQYISFESRHWILGEIVTIEETLQDPQVDSTQLVTELSHEISRTKIA